MKILIATHYYPEHVGGIELSAQALALSLCEQGHQVSWCAVSCSALGAISDSEEPFIRIALSGTNCIERWTGLPCPILSPRSIIRLIRAVKRADLVFIHDTLYLSSIVASLAAQAYKKRVLVLQHIGLVPYKSSLLRGLMHLSNIIFARIVLTPATQVVFYSLEVERYFRSITSFSCPPKQIPLGINAALFKILPEQARQELHEELGIRIGAALIIFVGRFVEKKGIEFVRNVAKHLPEHDFVIAGHGPIDPNKWGLGNVQVVGVLSQEQLVKLYNAADLLLLPSIGEGLPLVIQESLACGTSCVVSYETALAAECPEELCRPSARTVTDLIEAIEGLLALQREDLTHRERAALYAAQRWDQEESYKSYNSLVASMFAAES